MTLIVKRQFLLVALTGLVLSCSDKYLSYTRHYTFGSIDPVPNYSNPDYWAAHPWKWDPSDSVPLPLAGEPQDTLADVFFIYPTTFTDPKQSNISNAAIDDPYIAAKTDYTTILYQASVFNQHCRIFSPRYRQAHLYNFYKKDTLSAQQAFDLAYDDIKSAFETYLALYNNGRPIIIAAHSQGSKLGERLLKEFFDNNGTLKKRLIAAYIMGWPIPKSYFSTLKMCEDSVETGCLCGWRTFRKGYQPDYVIEEQGSSYVTNPLTWSLAGNYAPKSLNKGSVLTKFNKIYRQVTDAQVYNGALWVSRPRFPWGFLYTTKNYHVGDINLFYMNIRENVAARINAYLDHQ